MSPETPEQRARRDIDAALAEAGWSVQDRAQMNIRAAQGVAVREFPLKPDHGFADYMLFVDGKAVGVLEAKQSDIRLLQSILRASLTDPSSLLTAATALSPGRPLPLISTDTRNLTSRPAVALRTSGKTSTRSCN